VDNLFLFRLRDCGPFPVHHRSTPRRGIVRADGAICPPVGLNFQSLLMGKLAVPDDRVAVDNFTGKKYIKHCLNYIFLEVSPE
jgi:hypothetical protein